MSWWAGLALGLLSFLVFQRLRSSLGPEYTPVAPHDSVWSWNGPTNPYIINTFWVVDRMDKDEFKRLFNNSVVESSPSFIKFKQILVKRMGGSYWLNDKDYHIDRHILQTSIGIKEEATKEEVAKYIGELASQPLEKDRPLWRIYVIPNYIGGKTVMVGRFHHVIADGVALVSLIFNSMEHLNSHTSPSSNPKIVGRSWEWKKLIHLFSGLIQVVRAFLLPSDGLPLSGKVLSCKRVVSWSDPFPLDEVKKIKEYYNCSVNDVLASCVAGAFHRELLKRLDGDITKLKSRTLKAIIPINIRPPHALAPGKIKLENHISTFILPLAVTSTDAISRLKDTTRNAAQQKNSTYPFVVDKLLQLLKLTVPSLAPYVMNFVANKCTVIFTNVPGPSTPLAMGGHRMWELVPWVPFSGQMGWGVSVLSYAGHVQVGLCVDISFCSNPEMFISYFLEEFRELLNSTNKK
uniref:Uncharacterized protein n=1 Tax=Arcella intermedia TaxID=1963864 RepID=A0A6B2L3M8_9EUKA